MTRMLGDVGRGEYALLINQVALITMLMGFNLTYGITYFTAKSTDDLRKTIGTALTLFLFSAIVTPIVLWGMNTSELLSDLMMPKGRTQFFYWAFVYISIVMGLLSASIYSVMLGLKKFRFINGISLLNAVSSAVAFLLLFIYRDRLGPDILAPILVVTILIKLIPLACWCVLYAVHVKILPRPVLAWPIIRPILAFSLVGYLSNLINLINYRFDIWVVDHYRGAAELGLYAVAVGVGQMLFYVPDPFSRVVQPFLFGEQTDEMLARFKSVARLNFTALLILATGLGVLAPWIIPLLYGHIFDNSALALQLLLPGILFSGATKLLSQLVVQRGHQSFLLLTTSIGALITIGLDFLLIPRWGIAGASVASSVSYFSILFVLLLVIRSKIGIGIRDMFILRPADFAVLVKQLPWKKNRANN